MAAVGVNSNSPGSFSVKIPNSSSTDHEGLKRLQATEQRLKRMMKNRESARRSRMKKLEKLDEFKARINHLKEENIKLQARLNACHQSCIQLATENSFLRAKQNPTRVPAVLYENDISSSCSYYSGIASGLFHYELTVRFEESDQLIEDYFGSGNPDSCK